MDDSLIGSEVTSSPYQISFDSMAESDGSHSVVAVARDTSDNYATSTPVIITIDNTAPATPSVAPDMTTASDDGISSTDNITSITTPSFTGTCTDSQVNLYVDGAFNTYIGCNSGHFDITSNTLASGVHSIQYTEVDAVGNESGFSPALSITIQTIVPDTTAPTITTVTSTKSNATYGVGEIIDIVVAFSEAVTSTGNITVTLDTGRTCTFSVSNDNQGSCNYTVQAGDSSSDLTVTSIAGSIRDQVSNAMTNFTPTLNLGTNKNIVINTTVVVPPVSSGGGGGGGGPTVSSGSITSVPSNLQNILPVTSPVLPAVPAITLNPQHLTGKTFYRSLTYLSRGQDVMELQKFLNTHGFPVANFGVGSLGHETTLFGNATRYALSQYQKSKGIKPTVGFFGPITRKSVLADVGVK